MAISIKESLSVGFSDFWSRKLRSFIVILGIVLGTLSIVVVTSIINGINKQTLAWMEERGGLAKISVYRNREYQEYPNLQRYFDLKEFNFLRSQIPEAKFISPTLRSYKQFSYKKKVYYAPVFGVNEDYTGIEEWNVAEGRFINNYDLNKVNDVIVIGSKVKEALFGNKKAIGELITVFGRRLEVIGIMDYRYMKSSNNLMNDNALAYLNRFAFIPLTTFINKGTGEDKIHSIKIKAQDAESAPALGVKIENILLNMRKGKPVFVVESAAEEAKSMEKNGKIFQLVFTLISAISLFIGAIVVSNIMLATIKERTREIGIRIALGARRRDIFVQFLVQTILVSLIGGLLGLVMGVSILDITSKYLGIELIANLNTILMAVFSSAFVGLLAGIIPAIIASRLDPITALRVD